MSPQLHGTDPVIQLQWLGGDIHHSSIYLIQVPLPAQYGSWAELPSHARAVLGGV